MRARLARLASGVVPYLAARCSRRFWPSAHQLTHWAGRQGKAHQVKQALWAAYFSHGKDVHDIAVLADVADDLGLTPAEARAVLTDERYADAVREEERLWTSRGIHPVPAMVFAGQYLV